MRVSSYIDENANGTPKNGIHLTLSAEKQPMKTEKVLSTTSLESKSQKGTRPCQNSYLKWEIPVTKPLESLHCKMHPRLETQNGKVLLMELIP